MATVEWIPESRGNEETTTPVTNSNAVHQELRIPWRGLALYASPLIIAAILISSPSLRRPLSELLNSNEAVHSSESKLHLREWQLTANPEDTPVTSSAISPDGKLLVYSDPTGLYTKQIDTGETHPIPVPQGFDAVIESWFPDGSQLLVSWAEQSHLQPGLWTISVFGGQPRRIAREGHSASISPNGSWIASVRRSGAGEEVWLMHFDDGRERKLIGSVEDSFSRPAWAPDSTRFAYARTKTRYYANRRAPDTLIEVFDISGNSSLL